MREIIVDGYTITEEGNVYSFVNPDNVKTIGTPQTNGMLRIDTRNPISEKYGTSLIHRLVIAAFHPKFVDGTYDIRNKRIFVTHKNGDIHDNRYSNLNVELKVEKKSQKKWWVHDQLGTFKRIEEVVSEIGVSKTEWYSNPQLRIGWRKEVLNGK